jgi:hypothetical protein
LLDQPSHMAVRRRGEAPVEQHAQIHPDRQDVPEQPSKFWTDTRIVLEPVFEYASRDRARPPTRRCPVTSNLDRVPLKLWRS